jgi:hypothetical protein
MKARRILMELVTYSVFAFLVFSISYIHKDQRAFLLKHNVYSMLVQNPVSNTNFEKVKLDSCTKTDIFHNFSDFQLLQPEYQ